MNFTQKHNIDACNAMNILLVLLKIVLEFSTSAEPLGFDRTQVKNHWARASLQLIKTPASVGVTLLTFTKT